jgi:hypothetical protein
MIEYKYHDKASKKDYLNGRVNEMHAQKAQEAKDKMRALLQRGK